MKSACLIHTKKCRRSSQGVNSRGFLLQELLLMSRYILIADEPTGNLDPFVSFEIIKLLLNINYKGTAVLMATHNYDIVEKTEK